VIPVAPVSPAEVLSAARLLFAAAPASERESRAGRFAELVTSGEIDAGGLLLAKRRGKPVGAVVVQLLPGGSAVVLPPAPERGEASDALTAAVIDYLRANAAIIAHTFLDPADVSQADPLLRHGFRPAAAITHMLRDLEHLPPPPAGLTFTPSTSDADAFGEALIATYTGSLDVPEANTDRRPEQILAGYRPGQPDPPHWWLARTPDGTPVGVLILISPRQAPAWELGYLGVVPSARGHGHGRELLRFAMHTVFELGGKHLTLSVDTRNEPALSVYRGHGFRSYQEQRVFLWRADIS
jgi:ribosomal protein S18 acetylase RimI-like enzyme